VLGSKGGSGGSLKHRVNVEAPIQSGAVAFAHGSSNAVVTNDGEGLL
jgi:hypothetical protein